MLTIDPTSGTLRVRGFKQAVTPGLTHDAFTVSDLGRASTVLFPDRGYGDWWVRLPETKAGKAHVVVDLRFARHRLVSMGIMPLFAGDSPDGRSANSEAGLDRQNRWLRERVGVESREYPWGQVWSRYNINASRFDVGISYRGDEDASQARRRRRPKAWKRVK